MVAFFRSPYKISVYDLGRSLHATALSLSHRLHGGHNVVGSLEILENAVLELGLLLCAELIAGMGLLEGALTADGHHGVDELGVALHSDSLLVHD